MRPGSNRLRVAAFGAAVTVFLIAAVAGAARGDLDPSFGSGGKVTTDFGGYDVASAVAIQADGKVVAAGFTDANVGGGVFDFALARYNTDGSLDPSFGSGGKLTTDFGSFNDGAEAIAIQSDGKIVAAGSTKVGDVLGRDYDFALARYRARPSVAGR
jgi:uncharacterized delta-60 repeat protein